MPQALSEITELVKSECKNRNIDLQTNVEQDVPETIGCDVSRFLASPQIANRSWNAVHYTRPPDQPPMCQPWSLPPGLP